MVESERRVKDQITVEQRYYLMSIESDAQRFAESVRMGVRRDGCRANASKLWKLLPLINPHS